MHHIAAPLAAGDGGNPLVTFLPIILIIAVFYFLLVRPSQNRRKKQTQMQNQIAPGQQVMTTAALHATVVALEDDIVVLEIAPGVECRYNRQAIARVLTDDVTDAGHDDSDDADEDDDVEDIDAEDTEAVDDDAEEEIKDVSHAKPVKSGKKS